MLTTPPALLDRLRNPEYTGENRCAPCTLVNVLIALVVALSAGLVLSPVVGVVVLGLELAAIAFRGYLVPGTPALTKRYFPDWLLALFDKSPAQPRATVTGLDGDFDPEVLLTEVDAVEPCDDEDDLCLTASFSAAWRDEINRLRDDDARNAVLADVFTVDSVSVTSDRTGVAVSTDAGLVGRWPSAGALVADLSADQALAARADVWTAIAAERRFAVLAGLRSFLDACPLCDAPVEVSENTVESCCRSWEVLSIHCSDCEAELLELDPETFETVA